MPLFQQVGGSLTTAAALTLLAWGVETDPIPHLVIDIRDAESVKQRPVPKELAATALHLPLEEVEGALAGGESSWPTKLREKASPPSRDYLLVFVGDGEDGPRGAAAAAASRGFQRTAILEGGLESFGNSVLSQANLKFINRDAVAMLLGLTEDAGDVSRAAVVDLRRRDERTLYGTIPGTVHVPTDELPAALRMTSKQWKDAYRCERPGQNDAVVMQCRTNRRAAWAAQIAQDSGLQNCFVYRQGAYGWRLSPAVKAYRSYEKWDPPPEPEPFQVERVNTAAAKGELQLLGLA